MESFNYNGQTNAGQSISGSVNAPNLDDARNQLQSIGIRIYHLEPAEHAAPQKRLPAEELAVFNEQLIHLSSAGLPLERGLSLVAQDMQKGRLKSAIETLVVDLESGQSIDQAMSNHRQQFPPAYAQVVQAGIRSGNLPAILMNFGQHFQVLKRLRGELWKCCAYPLVVFVSLLGVLSVISYFVMPRYLTVAQDMWGFRTWAEVYGYRQPPIAPGSLPMLTMVVYYAGLAAPVLLALLLIGAIGWTIVLRPWLSRSGREGRWIDRWLLGVPFIGSVCRDAYLARWLDATAIGVRAGQDLPASIEMAGNVVALPSLVADGGDLIHSIRSGANSLNDVKTLRIPATVTAAMDMAIRNGSLPSTLTTLSEHYQRQCDQRVRNLPLLIFPWLLLALGIVAGVVMFGLWAPIWHLFNRLMGM